MRYKDFKKGDKVFCLMYGEGIIDSIDDYGSYPIFVKFKEQGDILTYNLNGKVVSDRRRTLYVIERKVGEEEVAKELNGLINNYGEKEFVFGEKNYFINLFLSDEGKFKIYLEFRTNTKELNEKYLLKECAEEIVNKLQVFINS